MNSDPQEKYQADDSSAHGAGDELSLEDHSATVNVPVFGCIVYVSRDDADNVQVRVANLAGLTATGASEREALAELIPAFKRHVSALIEDGKPMPWIDPPPAPEAGEQKRFIPVHL